MNPVAQQKLVELIKRFGPDVAADSRRCEALLRDFCGDQHLREVHVLVCAVRDGVASELLSYSGGTPKTVLLTRLATRLHDNYGIAEPLSHWAVESWALALGLVSLHELSVQPASVDGGQDQFALSPIKGSDPCEVYLVIDLSAGPKASNYRMSYLPSVPAGGWTDEYKTIKLVLRYIPAGTFIMGSPSDEIGRHSDEARHRVTLTQPFYIGVFEVTQKQWERVMDTRPSHFQNAKYGDTLPVEDVSFNEIRGSSIGAGWPANTNVDADSFMGRLRARTGMVFDLPTESQWEYAGRAGTTTALNSGKNLTAKGSCPHMAEVGRYSFSFGPSSFQTGNTSSGTATVGSYLPNQWGLYDIHGNVWEWCLDWYGNYPGTVSDPKGADSGSHRVLRGGSWRDETCRVALRHYFLSVNACNSAVGFRVLLPLGS